MKKIYFILVACLISSCNASDFSTTPSPNASLTVPKGTAISANFNFDLEIDSLSDEFDSVIPFEGSFATTMYFQENGTVSWLAKDFPKIVYRICAEGSSSSQCDMYYNPSSSDINLSGNDVDIVIDACGSSTSDGQCGENDDTVFSGTLTDIGTMVINDLQFRLRFFIATAEPNGYTATAANPGLDVTGTSGQSSSARLSIARATTGTVRITGGDNLSETGSRVENQAAVLVGGGIIPSTIPTIGGSYFIGTLDMTFADNPLEVLP